MSADVTVLTAVRSTDQHLLDRAYASLADQDVDWQWLVEVDGENAVTWRVDDPRVTVRAAQRNLGVSAARNLALVAAEAPWLTVLDADDELPPRVLRYVLDQVRSSGCFALSGALDVIDDATGLGEVRRPIAAPGTYPADSLPSLALELGQLPTPTQAVTFRTDALRAIGGWPGMVLCQDVAAFMLVAQRWPVQVTHEVVYRYHRRPGQSTSVSELAQHDLMLRSRILLAQQVQASRELADCSGVVATVRSPTY